MTAVKVYSTGCPRCRILESKMKDIGLEYELETDIEIMKEKGILSVPVIEVNGELKNYGEAIKYINSLGGN